MENQEQNNCFIRNVSTSELIAKIQEHKEENCNTRKVNPLELISKENIEEQKNANEAIRQKILDFKEAVELTKLINGATLGLTAYQKPASGIPFSDLSTDTQNKIHKLQQLIQEIKIYQQANVSEEEKQRWNQKQDKILDLEKIRIGASLGLTSLQRQLQSDWNETNISSAAFIKNKPELFSGSYNDLTDKPDIPTMQVNADWEADDGPAEILNKPTIPTKVSQLTNDSGFTSNQGTVTGVSVNGGEVQTPTNGVVNITAGKVSSIQIQSGTYSPGSNGKMNITSAFNTVAFTGDYNDLTNKPYIPQSIDLPDIDEAPTENSTNLVESGGVYTALEQRVPKPINTIYVTQEYWQTSEENTFSQDDTHYILIEDLHDLRNDGNERAFGKNCTFSANKGCRLGFGKIILNDTYVDAGQQHIFRRSTYYSYGAQVNGTNLEGSFANGRILPEWWGAKGGRGVYANGSYDNAASETLAKNNADAFNDAIYYAGNSEVYASAPVYLIGKTIYDRNYTLGQTLTSNISLDTDKRPRSFIKLYVEGDLIASNEFIGHYSSCGNAFIEFPAVIFLNGNSPRCIVKGAIVVPFSAQDKSIVIGNVPETLTSSHIGNLYFSYDSETEMYNVWDVYYHYTSETDDTKTIAKRQIGRFITTQTNLQHYRSSSYLYGGQYHNKDSNNYFKISGMYGISISSVGGYIEIGRILKGDTRIGFWNIAKGRKLMSYRYRTEVMHQGECTAVGLRCVKATTIKIGFIEGFNDGIAFDPTFSPDYDAIEFNRFEISSIACNYAIHSLNGGAYACLLNKDKGTQKYFDSCRWILGGFEPLGAGNHGLHSFCPTTSRSTYFLIENNAGHNDGFSCHWAEFNTAPLRWYTCIADIARGSDNQIIMHGNTSGDTGRVVLWTTKAGILSYSKWQVRMDIKDAQGNVLESNILHYKFPSQFNGGNQYIDYRNDTMINNCFQLADGESISQAMFPIDTFAGMESLYDSFNSTHPYAYAHMAAMTVQNGSNIWATSQNYPIGSRLAPYIGSTLQYNSWSYPYSDSRKYINFRGGSYKNIIMSGRRHMLCYESVYNDSESGSNEIRHAQSAYAMYEDTYRKSRGNWTVINSYHPVYDIVHYDRVNDPRNYGDTTSGASEYKTFVPDENTLACLQIVETTNDIVDNGLYVIKSESQLSQSSSPYKQTRYKLYEKYSTSSSNTNTRQVGWISEAFIPQHIKTINGQSLIGDGNINLNEYFNLTGSNQTVGLVVFGKFEDDEFYSGVYDDKTSPQWTFSETPYTRLINELYVDVTNDKLYRYNGTQYVEVSSDRGISVNQEILSIENY